MQISFFAWKLPPQRKKHSTLGRANNWKRLRVVSLDKSRAIYLNRSRRELDPSNKVRNSMLQLQGKRKRVQSELPESRRRLTDRLHVCARAICLGDATRAAARGAECRLLLKFHEHKVSLIGHTKLIRKLDSNGHSRKPSLQVRVSSTGQTE